MGARIGISGLNLHQLAITGNRSRDVLITYSIFEGSFEMERCLLIVLLVNWRLQHHRSGSSPDTNRYELDEAPMHDRSLNICAASPGKCHRGNYNTTSPYGCRAAWWLAGCRARESMC